MAHNVNLQAQIWNFKKIDNFDEVRISRTIFDQYFHFCVNFVFFFQKDKRFYEPTFILIVQKCTKMIGGQKDYHYYDHLLDSNHENFHYIAKRII